MKKKLSIIIPTLNEEKNIKQLVERIHNSLVKDQIIYEIIFIDDHSTDRTQVVISKLKSVYNISLYTKEGQSGKAFSLLEGFAKAKYDNVCMIDADLQYPPSAIPQMLARINKNTDIVITERESKKLNFARKFASKTFSLLFIRLIHGLRCDAQSGLKVFKKNILERITLSPTPWSFDLEFLLKAKNAGYKIESHKILFNKRTKGHSKISFIKASLEIGIHALRLRTQKGKVYPFHKEMQLKKGEGFHHKGNEYIHYTKLSLNESAFSRILIKQKIILTAIAFGILGGLIIDWRTTAVILIATLTILYFIDLLFNLFLVYRSFAKEPELRISKKKINSIPENEWPMYTIFCPLYKEWNVAPQFIKAIENLEYPKNKLQVLLLLEKDDVETVKKIQNYNLPKYFDIKVIPHSVPKTKPKALNYGLKIALGEYAVIYDAEDIPEPLQLKKSVLAFKASSSKTICMQAKLNFYNPHQNLLTKLFAAEYSLWFDLILTGLQSINAPIPLGGTSNHFRTADIKKLNGWDPFNVTEDADLGMRIAKRGYKTAIIDSYTMEEANSDGKNWFTQRSRWVKGYIQTYLVHIRNPRAFIVDGKITAFLTFQIIIGGKILSMLINPLMWIMTILYFTFRSTLGQTIESFYPTPILYMGAFSLIIGNFLYAYYYMLGAAKRNEWQLVVATLFTPFYWLGMSAAALYAGIELLIKPHYWHKTKHGLHLKQEDKEEPTENIEQRVGERKIAVVPAGL